MVHGLHETCGSKNVSEWHRVVQKLIADACNYTPANILHDARRQQQHPRTPYQPKKAVILGHGGFERSIRSELVTVWAIYFMQPDCQFYELQFLTSCSIFCSI